MQYGGRKPGKSYQMVHGTNVITETQATVELQVIHASKTYPGKIAEGLL